MAELPPDPPVQAPDPSADSRRPRRVSRRTVLVAGAGTAVVVAGGGLVAAKELHLRRWLTRRSGGCGEPAPYPPRSDAQITSGSFASGVLGEDVDYVVAVPSGSPQGNANAPVIYAMPGRSGTAASTIDAIPMQDYSAQASAQDGLTPLAFAYVDGGSSYWHARAGGEDRMAMLLQEFLPMVESRFGVGGRRESRGVMGWSMGGYGALLAAEQAPETFGAVAAGSPAIWTSYEQMDNAVGDAFDSAEDYARNNVFTGIPALAHTPAFIGVGTGDPFYANDRQFIDAFPAKERPETMFGAGCHAGDYWRKLGPAQVRLFAKALSPPAS